MLIAGRIQTPSRDLRFLLQQILFASRRCLTICSIKLANRLPASIAGSTDTRATPAAMRATAAPASAAPATNIPALTLPPLAIPIDASPTPNTGDSVMVMTPRWLDDIFMGRKTLVVQGLKRRPGRLWLGYGGKIYGHVEVTRVDKMTAQEFRAAHALHLWPPCQPLPCKENNIFGLTIAGVEALPEPLPYGGGQRYRRCEKVEISKKAAERRLADRLHQYVENIKKTKKKSTKNNRQTAQTEKAHTAKPEAPGQQHEEGQRDEREEPTS